MIATLPSRTNFAVPSAPAGNRSWTTRTNTPAAARRTRIAVWVSGQSPVTATIIDVARMKTQRHDPDDAVVGAGLDDGRLPEADLVGAERRGHLGRPRVRGIDRGRAGGPRPAAAEERWQQDPAHHRQVGDDGHEDERLDRLEGHVVPRSGPRGLDPRRGRMVARPR